MAEAKNKEFRKTFILVTVFLIVLTLFIYNRVRTNSYQDNQSRSAGGQENRYRGKLLDTAVLSDEKFKELKAIPKVSLGQAVTEVSANDLAKVPRRHSNPFKPF